MKKIFFFLLTTLIVGVGTIFAESGTCGDNLVWDLTDSVLTISGIGAMTDFRSSSDKPWGGILKPKIKYVVINEGVTTIGQLSFNRLFQLQSVIIPNSVISIGENAFKDDTCLTKIDIRASVPPTYDRSFLNCYRLAAIYIPCGTMDAYKQSWPDTSIIKYHPLEYRIIGNVNIAGAGNVIVPPTICDDTIITATTNYGYHFTQWSDGITDNPRTIVLTQDTTFSAEFAKNEYTITTLPNNSKWGTTAGDTKAFYLDEVEISATANYGYHFVKWSDDIYVCDSYYLNGNCDYGHYEENTDPVRTITVTEDKTYQAIFAKNSYSITKVTSSTKGSISGRSHAEYLDLVELAANPNRGYQFVRWTDGNTENPRTIELTQDTTLEAIFDYLLEGKCGKDSVLIWKFDPTTMALNIAGAGALSENYTYGSFIESLTIGNEITSIGQSAFYGCNNLTNVILGSSVKVLEESAFYGCSSIESITCYSQRPPTVNNYALYALDYSTIVYVPADYLNTYKMHDIWGLYDVRPLSNPTDPEVETGEYIIHYKDKNNEEIYQENVILHIPVAPQVEGFTFLYWQPVETNIANGFIIQAIYEAENPTVTPDVVSNPSNNAQKLIRQGNVYILTDNHTYTITGQEVK